MHISQYEQLHLTLSSSDLAGILFPAIPAGIPFPAGPVGPVGMLSPSDSDSIGPVGHDGTLSSSHLARVLFLAVPAGIPFPAGPVMIPVIPAGLPIPADPAGILLRGVGYYCGEWMDWCDFGAPDGYCGFYPDVREAHAQSPVSCCDAL